VPVRINIILPVKLTSVAAGFVAITHESEWRGRLKATAGMVEVGRV
jgi:hypothetical protein